jgi:RimJ/RimL family protein N-acetyltransferase
VHLSEEDKVVGAIAISSIDRESSQAELGFWIGKDYRGKGYAKEAIKLAASLAFSKFLLNRIYVYVLVSNEVSIHLLGSLGFVKEGLLRENTQRDGKFYDTLIFSLLKRDYKSLEKEARITINE